MTIRIGIMGYGNLGRGVECAIKQNPDMELAAVFTRRDPATVSIQTESAAVKHFDEMASMKDEIDVMILCGGSATDLPVIGPEVAASFNTIDSFDTHAKIPEYFANVDKAAKVVSPDLLTPSMQKLVDNNIVVSVRDKKTGKVGLSLVGATKDSFMHSEDKLVEVFDRNGIKLVSTKFNHEDNLLRTICRAVENLTKFVKR